MPAWLSLVLTFVLVLAFIGVVLLLVFFGLAQLAEVLPSLQAGVTAEEELLDYIPRTLFGYRLEEVRDVMTALLTSERLTSGATRFLSVLFTTVSQAFLAVSYTHLDVYKRQPRNRKSSPAAKVVRTKTTATVANCASGGAAAATAAAAKATMAAGTSWLALRLAR